MTRHQRKELEGLVALSTRIAAALLIAVAVVLVGAFFRGLQALVYDGLPLWLLPTALLFGWWFWYRTGASGGGDYLRRVRRDLESGQVRITILEPTTVIEVEEQEDEGPAYVIEDRDGGWFLLNGQELERYRRKRFPWARIGVVEAPHCGDFLGLKKLGDPIALHGTRPPFSYEEARDLGCFQHTFVALDEARRVIAAGHD